MCSDMYLDMYPNKETFDSGLFIYQSRDAGYNIH